LLSGKEKALYRVSLAYTKPIVRRVVINGRLQKTRMGRTIVQSRLVQKLAELFDKLLETRGMKIFKRGFAKAVALLDKEKEAVFTWAPRLKEWLKDADYIFWLGTVRQTF
jgi:glutathionyl-hydroquinone reductase